MWECPVCKTQQADKNAQCAVCGYDISVDWTRYPTLTRSGKIPCRQHTAPTPVEKKTSNSYFQNEQESPLQKDSNAWWKQNGWDFDTLNAEEVQQQVQKRIQKIQTEKREIRERVHRKIQTVQNQMRSESLKAKSEEVCFQKDEEPSYYDELLEILNGHEEVNDKKNSRQETSLQEEQGYYDELLAILNKRR